LRPGSIIGLSTHRLAQVEEARTQPLDYVALGPIFETNTKKDHEPVFGLDRLTEAKEILSGLPLVAIGGITDDRVNETLAAGADSVALISALLSDPPKIEAKLRKLLSLQH
jgi:thiamine-phosphate pyrophosphorylase